MPEYLTTREMERAMRRMLEKVGPLHIDQIIFPPRFKRKDGQDANEPIDRKGVRTPFTATTDGYTDLKLVDVGRMGSSLCFMFSGLRKSDSTQQEFTIKFRLGTGAMMGWAHKDEFTLGIAPFETHLINHYITFTNIDKVWVCRDCEQTINQVGFEIFEGPYNAEEVWDHVRTCDPAADPDLYVEKVLQELFDFTDRLGVQIEPRLKPEFAKANEVAEILNHRNIFLLGQYSINEVMERALRTYGIRPDHAVTFERMQQILAMWLCTHYEQMRFSDTMSITEYDLHRERIFNLNWLLGWRKAGTYYYKFLSAYDGSKCIIYTSCPEVLSAKFRKKMVKAVDAPPPPSSIRCYFAPLLSSSSSTSALGSTTTPTPPGKTRKKSKSKRKKNDSDDDGDSDWEFTAPTKVNKSRGRGRGQLGPVPPSKPRKVAVVFNNLEDFRTPKKQRAMSSTLNVGNSAFRSGSAKDRLRQDNPTTLIGLNDTVRPHVYTASSGTAAEERVRAREEHKEQDVPKKKKCAYKQRRQQKRAFPKQRMREDMRDGTYGATHLERVQDICKHLTKPK